MFVVNRRVGTAWGIIKCGEHHGTKLLETFHVLLSQPYIFSKEEMSWTLGVIK